MMMMNEGGAGEKVRIFVGGLGESVSSDDLRKIFSTNSSLGLGIQSMEIIRTKGRSFAYIDFLPSSHNSLTKLFNTYNGCVWKGGKLKLEKAKEHYLARLTREWAEDQVVLVAISNLHDNEDRAQDDTKNDMHLISRKPDKQFLSEDKKLRLFFPRLGKMKPIPFSGTGKHKYSFRRIEISTIPEHFCDCEEHSGPPPAAKDRRTPNIEEQSGGIDEEELNLMNSVMNKLFQMENVSDIMCREINLDKEGDDSVEAIDPPQLDENEGDVDEDDDNLIINMVSGEEDTILADQKPRFGARQTSEDEPSQHVLKRQKRKTAPSLNKSKSVLHEENNKEVLPYMPGGKESLLEQQSKSKNVSEKFLALSSSKEEQPKSDNVHKSLHSEDNSIQQENQNDHYSRINDAEVLAETPSTKLNSASSKTGRGYAWLNKSSWTQLVSGNNSSSFSITQIMPGITFEQVEPSKPDGLEVARSVESTHGATSKVGNDDPFVDGTSDLAVVEEGNMQKAAAISQQIVVGTTEASASVVEKKSNPATKQAYTGISVGETCSFMRTAASMKEWARTKAALTDRKRKNKEK